MKICSIILARPNSQRLPEKHKRLINGKMELEYVIDVCKQVSHVTVIATTDNTYYSIFGHMIDKYMFFNIPENDINLRIKKVHEKIKADYYLLVSADCPVLSAEMIQKLAQAVHLSGKDYVYGTGITSFCGVDVLRGSKVKDLIETNNICLKLQPKLQGIEYQFNEKNKYRITYDNHLDLEFLNVVAQYTNLNYEKTIKFLDYNEHLSGINEVDNNYMTGGSYLFIPTSNNEIGMGHLARSIAVAEEYNSAGGKVKFLIDNNPETISFIEKFQFKEGLDYIFKLNDELYTKIIYDSPKLTTLDWYNMNLNTPKAGTTRRLIKYLTYKPERDTLYSFGMGKYQSFMNKFQIEKDDTYYRDFYEKLANHKKIVTVWSQTAREALALGKEVECYTTNKTDAKICRALESKGILKYLGEIK